jgi:hypothetical protein
LGDLGCGDSSNSPFTAALVKFLPRPGLDLRKVFGYARDDVLNATNNKQEPFIYGSLGGDDVALVPATDKATADATPKAPMTRRLNSRSGNRSRTTRTRSSFRPISTATRRGYSRILQK